MFDRRYGGDLIGVIEQLQQTLLTEVSNVTEANQQMMASIEAMIVEHRSLSETKETERNEATNWESPIQTKENQPHLPSEMYGCVPNLPFRV